MKLQMFVNFRLWCLSELPAPQVLLGRPVRKVLPARLGSPAPRALLVLGKLAPRDQRARLAQEEKRARAVRRALLAHRAQLVS
jgi:hypothetical protein